MMTANLGCKMVLVQRGNEFIPSANSTLHAGLNGSAGNAALQAQQVSSLLGAHQAAQQRIATKVCRHSAMICGLKVHGLPTVRRREWTPCLQPAAAGGHNFSI